MDRLMHHLERVVRDIVESKIQNLRSWIMGVADDLKAEFEAYKTDVDTKVKGLQDADTALQTEVDDLKAAGADTDKLQSLLQEMKDAHSALVPPTT